jgi:hypothetical protein
MAFIPRLFERDPTGLHGLFQDASPVRIQGNRGAHIDIITSARLLS